MYTLRALFLSALALSSALCMQELELTSKTETAEIWPSRVPSLKNLTLAVLGNSLIKESTPISIAQLRNAYPTAEAECAHITAEDNRPLLWRKHGMCYREATLDHSSLFDPEIPENQRENTVYGAVFTQNDRFLITLTCRKSPQPECVLYAWPTEDFFKSCSEEHKSDQNTESLAFFNPIDELVLQSMQSSHSSDFKIMCSSNSHLFVGLSFGDCYLVDISEEGKLSKKWRLNALPKAQLIANLAEGNENERKLYEWEEPRFYVNCITVSPDSKKALIHLKKSDPQGAAVPERFGELYCIPLDNDLAFASIPAINFLDETVKIAHGVTAAIWKNNERLCYADFDNNLLEYDVTKAMTVKKTPLAFSVNNDSKIKINQLQLIPFSNKILLFSTYDKTKRSAHHVMCEDGGFRLDLLEIPENKEASANIFCKMLHDTDSDAKYADVYTSEGFHLVFLPREPFLLKIFKDTDLHIQITHINTLENPVPLCKLESHAEIYSCMVKDCFTFALSNNGKFLFLAEFKRDPGSERNIYSKSCNALINLATPQARDCAISELQALTSETKKLFPRFRE